MSGTRTYVALLVLAVAVATAMAQQKESEDIAVVVNPQNPISGLSLPQLRKIFRGEERFWSSKAPVLLLIRAPGAPERSVALKAVLQMSDGDYKQYWAQKILRGEATTEPVKTYSNGTQNEGVASIAGAIAFIKAREVRAGMKVLRIEGRLPGERGYPLFEEH
jgi:ABC-type phosphate transport system substrate-binding protein